MKVLAKQELKDKGRPDIFTDSRYKYVVWFMEYSMERDFILKEFLNQSTDFKAAWISDHMILFVDKGLI